MNPNLQRVIETMRAYQKSNHAWTRGKPHHQPCYIWQGDDWQRTEIQQEQSRESSPNTLKDFTVLSWNIDFMRTMTQERMRRALAFLQVYVEKLSRQSLILFNEMLVSDLEIIQEQPWIRSGYYLTDVSHEFWESGYYGTCVLVPRSLAIRDVFRVHYQNTAMERDGLFVDVAVGSKVVRICSTHLESLIADPPKRPSQLATAARFMHAADASILGGDLNAIQPFDKTLHSDNNLKDAYLETGGSEDAESGMTWGQMAAKKERDMFGLSRMDKLMFFGSLKVEHFETFGMDVVLDDEALGQGLMEENGLEKPWVTDHLGIRGDFSLIQSFTTESSNL